MQKKINFDIDIQLNEQPTPLDNRTISRKNLIKRAKNAINFRDSEYGIFTGMSFRDFEKFLKPNNN